MWVITSPCLRIYSHLRILYQQSLKFTKICEPRNVVGNPIKPSKNAVLPLLLLSLISPVFLLLTQLVIFPVNIFSKRLKTIYYISKEKYNLILYRQTRSFVFCLNVNVLLQNILLLTYYAFLLDRFAWKSRMGSKDKRINLILVLIFVQMES